MELRASTVTCHQSPAPCLVSNCYPPPREEDADLLVMGAYGQVAWREFLFGGATREVVGVSLLPLLLAH